MEISMKRRSSSLMLMTNIYWAPTFSLTVLGTEGTSLNKTKSLLSWNLYSSGGGIYVNKNNMEKGKAEY